MMLTKIRIRGCISELLCSTEKKLRTHCQQGSYKMWEKLVLIWKTAFFCLFWTFFRKSWFLGVYGFLVSCWIHGYLFFVCFVFLLLNHIFHLCTFCFSSLSSSGSALRLLYLWCLQLYYITCISWAGWCVEPAALLFVLLFLVYVTWVRFELFHLDLSCCLDVLKIFWQTSYFGLLFRLIFWDKLDQADSIKLPGYTS